MMDRKPLVSIGMPVFNGERYLRQALVSLLAQDYPDFELVISDNASTDRTQEICLEFAAQDDRIQYHRNSKNQGPIWNFNRVFELAAGTYFMWASDDDYWAPNYLTKCLAGFEVSENVILAGGVCESIEMDTGQLLYADRGITTVGQTPSQRFKAYKSLIHSGHHIGGIFYGLFRRTELRKVIPAINVLAVDHLILARLSLEGEFVTVPERLMMKRYGGASSSITSTARALDIRNPFLISFPYLIREFLLQKMIFTNEHLNWSQKLSLAIWSFWNYLSVITRLRFFTGVDLILRRLPLSFQQFIRSIRK
jgi:glycosyltransferase involved in cell wall biosynthesis